MSDLVRVFCPCGNELDENDPVCPICHGDYTITFDPETHNARKPKIKRTKAHDSTCECDKCEEMQIDRSELDFG